MPEVFFGLLYLVLAVRLGWNAMRNQNGPKGTIPAWILWVAAGGFLATGLWLGITGIIKLLPTSP